MVSIKQQLGKEQTLPQTEIKTQNVRNENPSLNNQAEYKWPQLPNQKT